MIFAARHFAKPWESFCNHHFCVAGTQELYAQINPSFPPTSFYITIIWRIVSKKLGSVCENSKYSRKASFTRGGNRAEQEAEKTYGNMSVKNDMSYLLSVDVLITPYIISNTEWPSGLVTNFGDKCADLGTMESSGSLWKLIKREGLSYDGLFVVLQSAEIGEKISYLRSDLTMSPN